MTNTERDYCLRRADEERELAAATTAPDVARRHVEMAGLYELRARDPAAWAALTSGQSD